MKNFNIFWCLENTLQGVWLAQVPHHGQGVVLLHHVDPSRGVQRHVRPDHVQGEALRHPDGVALRLNSLYTISAYIICRYMNEQPPKVNFWFTIIYLVYKVAATSETISSVVPLLAL